MQKNQKIIIAVIGLLIIAIIATVLIINSGKDEDINYIINSELYPNLYSLGEIIDNNFSGETQIIDPDSNFRLKGQFENGVFKEGYISFVYNDIDYYLTGTFNDFNLQEGSIEIYDGEKKVEKRGTFEDNKLNGSGSLVIKNSSDSSIIFSYAGKFENDVPVYN